MRCCNACDCCSSIFQSILMTDSGMIFKSQPDTNLPKMKINKRQLTKGKSILQNIFHQTAEEVSFVFLKIECLDGGK